MTGNGVPCVCGHLRSEHRGPEGECSVDYHDTSGRLVPCICWKFEVES